MGVGITAGIIAAGVGVATLVAQQTAEADKRNDAKKAAESQKTAAQQAADRAQVGAATLDPVIKQQQDLAAQTAASNGLGNQSSVFNQQQQLANQLQAASMGQGPNPALAQLAQTTGANTANQAALMAGQRGAGANVGLMGRQIAQQGAANQQTAVGQAATLGAQQQIAARQQLGQQQSSMGQLATSQVGQQLTAQQQASQAAIQQQQLAQGLALGQQSNANTAQGQSLAAQQQASQALAQGMGGVASGLGAAAQTGLKSPTTTPTPSIDTSAAGANNDMSAAATSNFNNASYAEGGQVGPKSYVTHHIKGIKMAKGGKVPAMVSPGEIYLKPDDAKAVASGKKSPLAGERIPGKAKVKGNSLKNDTVPKTLDEGGVVIPRSELTGPNAHAKAYKFVNAAIGKSALKPKK